MWLWVSLLVFIKMSLLNRCLWNFQSDSTPMKEISHENMKSLIYLATAFFQCWCIHTFCESVLFLQFHLTRWLILTNKALPLICWTWTLWKTSLKIRMLFQKKIHLSSFLSFRFENWELSFDEFFIPYPCFCWIHWRKLTVLPGTPPKSTPLHFMVCFICQK